ncbi:unnamed protein product [Periconia digitata]|uniref:Sucrose transport protein n=1 Tax=Periconia digitata TaxID=1303443 RepID=A0A9W4UFG4_9PLEO|nr:unnamed protein product [Periconia digitata]
MVSGGGNVGAMMPLAQYTGTPSVRGSSDPMRMALLTLSLVGLQITWNVEMTYCTPYLLELGLTKSRISLVWIAGPLSGLIMQPVVGVISDRSKNRWGRRRPFMVGGTILVSIFLLLLGWTKEVIQTLGIRDKEAVRDGTIVLAVLSIYGIDFAINAVQGSCRGLIVDTLPIPKQQSGSSWASRMVAVGSLVGYAAGAIDLGKVFGTLLGDSQFKQSVAALCLCITVGITSWAVTERVLVSDGLEGQGSLGALDVLKTIAKSAIHLPKNIQAICTVQFWAWIGWFPFLFYSTTWVGEIYLRYDASADEKSNSDDLTGKVGRIGSLALIAFSIITFIMSVLLPFFVKSPEEETRRGFRPRSRQNIASFAVDIEKYKPSLLNTWMFSHCIFAASMVMAPFVQSLRGATIIVALCGVSWAVSCWAPFTFLGEEINRLSQSGPSYGHLTRSSIELESPMQVHNNGAEEASDSTGENSGKYLGILNVYTTLPQFVGTAISWVVFSLLEPGKSPELSKGSDPSEHHGTDGPNGIGVCLFIGAVCAGVAAVATRRLKHLQND